MDKTTREKRKEIRKKRILVVEDDPAVMKMYRELLTRSGCEVTEASYGLPAMFRVVREPPDLILADLHMPTLNGLELIDQLKAHRETREIPILVVTGSNSEQDRKAAFAAGCTGYLAKPVDPKEFLKQVVKFLRRPSDRNMNVPIVDDHAAHPKLSLPQLEAMGHVIVGRLNRGSPHPETRIDN